METRALSCSFSIRLRSCAPIRLRRNECSTEGAFHSPLIETKPVGVWIRLSRHRGSASVERNEANGGLGILSGARPHERRQKSRSRVSQTSSRPRGFCPRYVKTRQKGPIV